VNIVTKIAAPCYIVILFCMLNICAVREPLTFDILFLQTPYQKALHVGMQIWGDLEMLNEQADKISGDQYNVFFDMVAGRLIFMHVCLEEMMQSQAVIMRDDLSYVADIVNEIKQLTTEQHTKYEHIKSVKRAINQLSSYIDTKLQ
jgi:hypothetical protein